MSSISFTRTSYGDFAGVQKVVHLLALAVAAASLGACAQSSVVANKSEVVPTDRRVSLNHDRDTSALMNRGIAATRKHHAFASRKDAPVSQGIASFYTEGTQTANGERFDPHELTAAHPTLPFGTRLRVTNVATGRSVTVRVNDRGPFVPGRVVDVSYSAAQTLGMVGAGTAKVTLDVVE